MEDVEWEDAEDLQQYIKEEPTRVGSLPPSITCRSFMRVFEDSTVRCSRSAHTFHVYKRKRYESEQSLSLAQPLLRVLTDPFDRALRQQETFHWLEQPRTAEEMSGRFAVDRRLGVRPSLACANRAINALGRDGHTDAVLDILEDLMVDGETIALSTATRAVLALQSQPMRAARLALSLSSSLGKEAVSAGTWTQLCYNLAKYSQQMAKPLNDHFIDLLQSVLNMVRRCNTALSESLVVNFGSCLLASTKPVATTVTLVQDQLLGGRTTEAVGHSSRQLSVFFSDLLSSVCSFAIRELGPAEQTATQLLVFCGDVIKYAFARRVTLMPTAFDAVLALCDRSREFYRMIILYVSMCVLSTPTLRSTLRVTEALSDIPELGGKAQGAIRRPPLQVVLWSLKRFPAVLEAHRVCEEAALTALCTALGRAIAHDSSAAYNLSDALATLSSASGNEVVSLTSTFLHCLRSSGKVLPLEHLSVLEPCNNQVVRALMPTLEGGSASRFLALFTPRQDATVTLQEGLRHALSSPQVYCNVLDVSAINALGESQQAEAAFARMMDSYAAKTGAIAVVPTELICPTFGLSCAARAMLSRWPKHHSSWFDIIPLSLSLQLQGRTCVELCCDLQIQIRASGHAKVAFVAKDQGAVDAAKARGVHPTIFLPDLLKRLGVPQEVRTPG